jgi:hypothetical protein
MPILFNMELHAGPRWHFYIQDYTPGNLYSFLTDYAGKNIVIMGQFLGSLDCREREIQI